MHRSMTLKQRITLGLAAFLLALAVQIFLSFYQSGTVMQRLDDQMGQFNAISRFQGGVERGLTVLGDYRWEYGDADALLSGLDSAFSTTDAWLWRIDGSLETVSEEEYLLYSAVCTTYKSYTALVKQLEAAVRTGDDAGAARLYYDQVLPCGSYLRQYTQQLLKENASKDEAKAPDAETPAAGAAGTGSSEDGTPEEGGETDPETPDEKDTVDTDASAREDTEGGEEADSKETDAAEKADSDKKQEQGEKVIESGSDVVDKGQNGSSVTDYNDAVKDQNEVTKENESKTDDAELAAAKDALDAAQKEVEKAQEAVDAATSIEERNALIEKLNEAVEKKKRKTKDPNFSPAWKSSDLFYKIPPGRHSSILPDKLHRLVDHKTFPGGLFSGRLYASWHKAKVVIITMTPTTSAKRILI